MIQGKAIKERDTIDRPNVNYRQLEALNKSMIALFDSDPVKFYEQFKLGKKKKDSKTTSLIIGDLVDFYLLDCGGDSDEFDRRFDEKFALMEGTKGTGQVFILADIMFELTQADTDEDGTVKTSFDSRFTDAFTKVQAMGKYKGASEDKALKDFSENGFSYFQTQLDNIGKTVIEVSLVDKAKKVAELLMNDEFTKDVFTEEEDEEYFPKHPIEWVYHTMSGKDIKCKSEVDILKVDHKNKIIYPRDLKTTFDNENFEYAYTKYRYDLQAAFYTMAVRYWADENDMKDYTVYPMEFIVGDTSSNNRRPIRYQLSSADINYAITGYTLRGVYYKGIRQLLEEISWAEDTDNWNVSKDVFDANGRLALNINYE